MAISETKQGWIDEDAMWYGGIGLIPGHIVLDDDPYPRPHIMPPTGVRPMKVSEIELGLFKVVISLCVWLVRPVLKQLPLRPLGNIFIFIIQVVEIIVFTAGRVVK